MAWRRDSPMFVFVRELLSVDEDVFRRQARSRAGQLAGVALLVGFGSVLSFALVSRVTVDTGVIVVAVIGALTGLTVIVAASLRWQRALLEELTRHPDGPAAHSPLAAPVRARLSGTRVVWISGDPRTRRRKRAAVVMLAAGFAVSIIDAVVGIATVAGKPDASTVAHIVVLAGGAIGVTLCLAGVAVFRRSGNPLKGPDREGRS